MHSWVVNDLAACELRRREDMRRGLDVIVFRCAAPLCDCTTFGASIAADVMGCCDTLPPSECGRGFDGWSSCNGYGFGTGDGAGGRDWGYYGLLSDGFGSGAGSGSGTGKGSGTGNGFGSGHSDVGFCSIAGVGLISSSEEVLSCGVWDSHGDGTGSGAA